MKKVIIYIVVIVGTVGLAGCKDQKIEFPDYTLQAVYFPIQLPLRTLSLGEDRIDNSLDKELKFDIGVSIGGMYENSKDWTVDYVVADTLTNNVYNQVGEKILPLPSNYYTLSPANTAVIPKGSFSGMIRVQLTNQFLDDTLAISGHYVIPLRITGTSADSILRGFAAVKNPDIRVADDWEAGKLPRDWVMFGIKYINAYHGSYLHRGMDIRYQGGVPVDTAIYHKRFVERDQIWEMKTIAKAKVVTNGIGNNSSTTGKYAMELEFTNVTGSSGAIVIKPRKGSLYSVSGTGQYFDRASSVEGYMGLIFQSMHLIYSYTEGAYTHQVKDTLIFRDRGIKFEQLSVVVTKP